MKVLFWRDAIVNITKFNEEYSGTIVKLIQGDYKSLHLEKLRVNSITPIFSIRHSASTRILFTTHQGQICILEVILNHDYHKSRYLRNRHCLQNTLEKLNPNSSIATEAPTDEELSELPCADGTDKEIILKNFDFQEHFIELSEDQENTLRTTFPFVLHGPAGSGKTTLAIALLQNLVRLDKVPAIYVTQSERLKNHVERLWRELQPEPVGVTFLTYQDFLVRILNVERENLTQANDFSSWFTGLRHEMKTHLKKLGINEKTLHQEFRILSALINTPDTYLKLGKKQSLVEIEHRAEIIDLFRLYQKTLGTQISAEFSCVVRDASEEYHVIADEAQDFSFAQLNTLLNFSGPRAAILLGDHQTLHDGTSRHAYIKQYFFDAKLKTSLLSTHCLANTYRCPGHVNLLANQLINFKYQATGGKLDKLEVTRMDMDREKSGMVEWIDASSEILDSIQQHHFQTPCAIIDFEQSSNTRFHTELHFNAIQCKGLEFDTVILWNPFLNLDAMNAACQNQSAAAIQENADHLSYFNQIITAVTRSKKRLVIVHAKNAIRPHPFIEALKNLCVETKHFIEDVTVFSKTAWFDQILILLNQGLDEQALAIFKTRLNGHDEEFEKLKNKLLTKELEMSITKTISHPSTCAAAESPISAKVISRKPLTTLSKNNLSQHILADATAMLETFFDVQFMLDLFKKYDSAQLQKLLTYQIGNKPILQSLQENQKSFENFVLSITSCPDILFKIAPIAKTIKKSLKDQTFIIDDIFSLIVDNASLCTHAEYTFLHLASQTHHHQLLRICLKISNDPNISDAKMTAFHYAFLKGNISEDSILTTLRILKRFDADFRLQPKDIRYKNLLCSALQMGFKEAVQFMIQETNYPMDNEILQFIKICVEDKHHDMIVLLQKSGFENSLIKYLFKFAFLKNVIFKHAPESLEIYPRLGFNFSQLVKEGHYEFSIVHLAIELNRVDVLKYLHEKHLSLTSFQVKLLNNTLLEFAMSKDHFECVSYLLSIGVNPNERGVYTPAGYAAKNNNKIEILEELKKYGADFNRPDLCGNTPIMIALEHNSSAIIKFLIADESVDLHMVNDDGNNLLHFAVRDNHVDWVAYFLSKKVNHQTLNKFGFSPLGMALLSSLNNFEIAKIMVTAGIELSIENKKGHCILDVLRNIRKDIEQNRKEKNDYLEELFNQWYQLKYDKSTVSYEGLPLHLATQEGDIERMQTLLEQDMDVNSLNDKNDAPIHIAAKIRNPAVLRLLLEHHADMNLLNGAKMSALMIACRAGCIDNALELIKRDVDLDFICPITQRTAIAWSLERYDIQVVEKLILKRANTHCVDSAGKTLLMMAAINDNPSAFVEFLISKATDKKLFINYQDKDGRTALHYACINLNEYIIATLLKYGADAQLVDKQGNHALHLFTGILRSEKQDFTKQLIEHGADINAVNLNSETPWMTAIKASDELSLKILIELGANLDARNISGETFSHYVCKYFKKQKLLKYQDRLIFDARNQYGQTPLDLAFIHKNFEVFEYLRTLNATVDNKDTSNKSLFHWAAELGMVHYLEEFMASRLFDINEKDSSGNTALDYAIMNHHKKSIKFLKAAALLEVSPAKIEVSKIKYGGGAGFFETNESSHTSGDPKYIEDNSCCNP